MTELTTDKVQVIKRSRTDYKEKYFTARAYCIFFACAAAGLLVYSVWRAH